MPGLVANVVLCLGLIKNKSIKSNLILAVQHRRRKIDRHLCTFMPPTDLTSSMAQVGLHRYPLAALMAPSHVTSLQWNHHSVKACDGQVTESMEQLEHWEEMELETQCGEDQPVMSPAN